MAAAGAKGERERGKKKKGGRTAANGQTARNKWATRMRRGKTEKGNKAKWTHTAREI